MKRFIHIDRQAERREHYEGRGGGAFVFSKRIFVQLYIWCSTLHESLQIACLEITSYEEKDNATSSYQCHYLCLEDEMDYFLF